MDTATFSQTLLEEDVRLELGLSADELDALCLHYELLCKWNRRIRIAGTVDPKRAAVELFADSLVACRFAERLAPEPSSDALRQSLRVLDIGAGAGLPGFLAKILRPGCNLTCVDNNAKKMAFLKRLAQELGLADVEIARARAEALSKKAEYRETFDLAFCRAVAAPPIACELAIPFLKAGGVFVLQTVADPGGEGGEKALERVRKPADILGATIGMTKSYMLSSTGGSRLLVEIRKVSETPAQFPRDAGTIKKRPLS